MVPLLFQDRDFIQAFNVANEIDYSNVKKIFM